VTAFRDALAARAEEIAQVISTDLGASRKTALAFHVHWAVLAKVGLRLVDIDLFEVNEAGDRAQQSPTPASCSRSWRRSGCADTRITVVSGALTSPPSRRPS
jgi:hypothetical protein